MFARQLALSLVLKCSFHIGKSDKLLSVLSNLCLTATLCANPTDWKQKNTTQVLSHMSTRIG